MRKGQKSLEMVIGLIILLVVAAVVIKLFLGQMNPERIGRLGPKQVELRLANEEITCRQLCSQFINNNFDKLSAVEYCKHFVGIDINENGDIRDYFEYRTFDICEDHIYCFHMYDCRWDVGKLDFNRCLQIMCEFYTESKGGQTQAETYLRNIGLTASKNKITIDKKDYYTCVDWDWLYNVKPSGDASSIWVGYKPESWYNSLLQENFCTPGSSGLKPPEGGGTGCTKYCTDKGHKSATSSSCISSFECKPPNKPEVGYSGCSDPSVQSCCCVPKSGGGL